jgi:hypothetical protein
VRSAQGAGPPTAHCALRTADICDAQAHFVVVAGTEAGALITPMRVS